MDNFRATINNWTIKIIVINIIWYLLLSLAKCEDMELNSVVVVFRHGDRTPVRPYATDPYKNRSLWPADWGMLTNTGKMQHYNLGKYFRQRYANFLPKIYSEKDILVKSTDVDRTLMSAEAHLAGLFPPYENDKWNENLQWQPIPIHTIPEKLDAILAAKKPCSKYQALETDLLNNEYFQNISHKNHDLYAYLTQHSGGPITDLRSLEYLYSTLNIETLYNFTLPDWTQSVFPNKMQFYAFLSFATSTFTLDLTRLKTGPFFYELLNYFHNRSSSVTNASEKGYYAPKYLIYSAHDTTIANLLNTLGAFQLHAPPYCATIIFELYQSTLNNTFFVNIFYKNSSAEPQNLQVRGCDFNCDLYEFTKIMQEIAISPKQWQYECNDDLITVKHLTLISLELIPILIILVIGIIVIIKIIKKVKRENYKKSSNGLYIKLPNDDCSS